MKQAKKRTHLRCTGICPRGALVKGGEDRWGLFKGWRRRGCRQRGRGLLRFKRRRGERRHGIRDTFCLSGRSEPFSLSRSTTTHQNEKKEGGCYRRKIYITAEGSITEKKSHWVQFLVVFAREKEKASAPCCGRQTGTS